MWYIESEGCLLWNPCVGRGGSVVGRDVQIADGTGSCLVPLEEERGKEEGDTETIVAKFGY